MIGGSVDLTALAASRCVTSEGWFVLSDQNIESELSYAYLHAVASRGGFSCAVAHRHLDDACIDATIHEDGRRLAPDSILTSFEAHIQLKATYQVPAESRGCFSYSLKVTHYDRLRSVRVNTPRLLVVLYLPPEGAEWLTHSEDCLVAKRCAYWVSLKAAPPTENLSAQTIYIPRRQVLSTAALTGLMTRFSRREEVCYEGRADSDTTVAHGDA